MLKKLIKVASIALLSLTCISLTLFVPWTSANALDESLSPEANGDNPLGIVIEPSADDQKQEKAELTKKVISIEELLGEEQVFPFQP